MKQITLAVALFISLFATLNSAAAQCNGNFGANSACGTVGGGLPGPISFSSIVSGGGAVIGPSTSTIGCAALWANTTGTQLANNCALSISGTTITATGLLDVVATAGGVSISGNPNIPVSFSGATPLAGMSNNLTANSATSPEVNQFYSMTSATGSTNATAAYKMNVALNVACNSGSAYCWNLNPVMNIGTGGSKRGGIVVEADLNNNWGNYTGSPASPYATNFYATGTNGGGYGSCAFCAEYGGSGALWQAALHGGPANSTAYNTAFIWDESNSPSIVSATGSHINGIHLNGASFSGHPFDSPGFIVDASGDILSANISSGGVITDTQSIGATSTDGMILANTTAAAVGAQQWSPRLHFVGQGWKTASTAASETVDWIIEAQPIQGSSTPTVNLVFSSQVNAGGYTLGMSLTSGGALNVDALTSTATISAGTTVNAAVGSGYLLGGNNLITNSSTTYTLVYDEGGASGVLQLGNTGDPTNYYQNTTHIFRNRAQNANFATINSTGLNLASGEVFSVGASTGVTKSGTCVITAIVGGIVTGTSGC